MENNKGPHLAFVTFIQKSKAQQSHLDCVTVSQVFPLRLYLYVHFNHLKSSVTSCRLYSPIFFTLVAKCFCFKNVFYNIYVRDKSSKKPNN